VKRKRGREERRKRIIGGEYDQNICMDGNAMKPFTMYNLIYANKTK
jgi:hypothetical protein